MKGDAKKAMAETLEAQVAELKSEVDKSVKGTGKSRGNKSQQPKEKKEKTPEQLEIKELQKDVKAFPGLFFYGPTFVKLLFSIWDLHTTQTVSKTKTAHLTLNHTAHCVQGLETTPAKPGSCPWI